LAHTDFGRLILKTKNIIQKPEIGRWMEKKALEYADRYSWKNQAQKHLELAQIAALSTDKQFGYCPTSREVVPARTGMNLPGAEYHDRRYNHV